MGVGGCCSGSVHTGREKTSIFFVIKKTEVTQARELALSHKAEGDSASDSFGLARHPQPLWFLKPNGLAASRINPAPVQGGPSRPLAAGTMCVSLDARLCSPGSGVPPRVLS